MGGLEALLTGGVASVLGVVIVYLLVANRQDRVDYRRAVGSLERRYDDEVDAHGKTQKHLDEERELRRRAEDTAARAAAAVERSNEELVKLRERIAALESEVHQLRGGPR